MIRRAIYDRVCADGGIVATEEGFARWITLCHRLDGDPWGLLLRTLANHTDIMQLAIDANEGFMHALSSLQTSLQNSLYKGSAHRIN